MNVSEVEMLAAYRDAFVGIVAEIMVLPFPRTYLKSGFHVRTEVLKLNSC